MNVNEELLNKYFTIETEIELSKAVRLIGRLNDQCSTRVSGGDVEYWKRYDVFMIKRRQNVYYISSIKSREDCNTNYIYKFNELINIKKETIY